MKASFADNVSKIGCMSISIHSPFSQIRQTSYLLVVRQWFLPYNHKLALNYDVITLVQPEFHTDRNNEENEVKIKKPQDERKATTHWSARVLRMHYSFLGISPLGLNTA
jgi:hypothetical protein